MFDIIIVEIVPYSIFLPIIIALFRFRGLHKALKLILFYLIICAAVNFIARSFAKNGMNNMPFFHFFTAFEFTCLLLFFFHSLPDFFTKKSFYLVLALFSILFLINITFLQSIWEYNTYTKTLEAFFISFFSLRFFYKLLDQPNFQDWRENGILWINFGIILYFSGAVVLFLFSELMAKAFKFYEIAWTIHALLLLLMYILFSIGFIKFKTKPGVDMQINQYP